MKHTESEGKRESGTSSVSVRLSDAFVARVDERARLEHRSRGNLIRMLLEQAIGKDSPDTIRAGK